MLFTTGSKNSAFRKADSNSNIKGGLKLKRQFKYDINIIVFLLPKEKKCPRIFAGANKP